MLYKSIAIVSITALIGGVIAFTQNIESLASFEAGFIGFTFVVGSSFVILYKRVKAQNSVIETDKKEAQEQELQEKMPNFSTRFVIGAQTSLSFLRVLSYVLFALMLIALFEYQLFSLSWFFAGLCVAMIMLIGLGILGIAKAKSQ